MTKISHIAVVILLVSCNNNNKLNQSATTDTTTTILNKDSSSTSIHETNNIDSVRNQSDTGNTNKLIIPGERIGKAVLNSDAENLEQLFGKPEMSDAAMGKAWLTWYSKKKDEHNNKTRLDIYTTYKDTSMRDKTVQQVRTSSSYFVTESGIHVYSSLEDIKNAFPEIQRVQQNGDNAKKSIMYDDLANGIAFQIVAADDQNICKAILIHNKGKKVNDIYIPSPF
jgi:hypothetical protein